MDTPKHPPKAEHLLDDLESIRELLDDGTLDPPLLTETVDADGIPVLSEVIAPPLTPPAAPPAPARAQPSNSASSSELKCLDDELHAAAQLLLQDVIDDFVPQIEAELKRRLEARLGRLLSQRKP
ncbi:DNA polymerase III subunit chi [Pseudomonas cavernae]|uniref:DNA polymerase III subunit chi n=1 Tax=Pseudomonas cavernae TaxID=2320867 RepID=A0A385YZT4_9PSED|nr:DNA polymerase III subunit chi [Pseudomonas cavernae]AYC31931.1 DNA polymerase III subunit chi [Pseudomonas cavernae]